MKTYLILITMTDGSQGRWYSPYCDGFEAVIQVITDFPDACRVSARRLP